MLALFSSSGDTTKKRRRKKERSKTDTTGVECAIVVSLVCVRESFRPGGLRPVVMKTVQPQGCVLMVMLNIVTKSEVTK